MEIGEYEEIKTRKGNSYQLCTAFGALTELQQVAFGAFSQEKMAKIEADITAGKDQDEIEKGLIQDVKDGSQEGGWLVQNVSRMNKMLAIVVRAYKTGEGEWKPIGSIGPGGANDRFNWCYEFMPFEDGMAIITKLWEFIGEMDRGVETTGELRDFYGVEQEEVHSPKEESSQALPASPS